MTDPLQLTFPIKIKGHVLDQFDFDKCLRRGFDLIDACGRRDDQLKQLCDSMDLLDETTDDRNSIDLTEFDLPRRVLAIETNCPLKDGTGTRILPDVSIRAYLINKYRRVMNDMIQTVALDEPTTPTTRECVSLVHVLEDMVDNARHTMSTKQIDDFCDSVRTMYQEA